MKQIALITGASSGMGREFVLQIAKKYKKLDELWVIARRRDRLEALKEQCELPIRIIAMDITKEESIESLCSLLKAARPHIRILVNSAGCGKMGNFTDISYDGIRNMILLNCEALTAVTYACIPYMPGKSRILMLASSASFAPQPEFAVYAASKSFVLSFSRALRQELKDRKITVTAICPGPVNTEFFDAAGSTKKMSSVKKMSMAKPEAVVEKALKDASLGRELSVYGMMMKGSLFASKCIPHGILVPIMDRILNKK